MDYREQAARLVEQMTLDEKASLCAGVGFWHTGSIPRLGLNSIRVSDGPHGLRKPIPSSDPTDTSKSVPATSFPTASAAACSFDRDLLRRMGEALGEKCIRENVNVLLGPGVNIKRSPLCGRNFEYFSEDPYLAGELAAEIVRGLQSRDTGACVKHFAANNQEAYRMSCDSVVDERTLQEIYFPAFETVVKKAQPWTVMCSYNKLNGVHASENKWLLTDMLRTEWGFDGAVISDWGAVCDRAAGLFAGLDLEMPAVQDDTQKLLVQLVSDGVLSAGQMDQCAAHVAELILKAQGRSKTSSRTDADDNALAREIAVQSAVLLKNDDAVLPLNPESSVAFIGRMAKSPRYQGAGSSRIHPAYLDNAMKAAEAADIHPLYADGYSTDPGKSSKSLIAAAVSAAKAADTAVVFAGLPDEYESEGFDRTDMNMPATHIRLIEAVAEANPNTIVVLQCGSPVAMPWRDKVKGILLMYLAGQAGGAATVDLLFGKECPSGKLAETWPEKLEDTPAAANYPGGPKTAQYREGIFVGYRYYDAADCPVAYPFGFGLSYTQFAYSDLAVLSLGHNRYKVTLNIQNVGAYASREAVQLYVARKEPGKIFRAPKELKGFEKVALEPGKSAAIEFRLDARSFAYFNAQSQKWCIEGGKYQVLVGATSRDLPLCREITLEGDGQEDLVAEQYAGLSDYQHPAIPFAPSEEQFAQLLGHEIPADTTPKEEPFTVDSTLEDIRRTSIGKRLMKQIKENMNRQDDDPLNRKMMEAMAFTSPLRELRMFAGLSWEQIDGIVDMANNHYLRGSKKFKSPRSKTEKMDEPND